MKFAYVVNNVVQLVTDQDYSAVFGFQMVPCPDNVQNYWLYDPVLDVYSPPPPPPLTVTDFENAFNSFAYAKAEAKRLAKFQAAMALSPNSPGLPDSVADFLLILNGLEWE